jgi:Na+-transporting NADH:ubiquinone oxidoreductase subunit E
LATKAIFAENLALAFFLGMCPFLAISRRVDSATGLGLAVTFVLGITCPLNQALHLYFLRPGALDRFGLEGIDLSFLTFLVLIGTIAATVQFVEMFLERFLPTLYTTLGIYLPLIAVNCAILGGSLFAVEREYSVVEAGVFGVSSGVGWALAAMALAAIRERLRYNDVPPPLRGLGISFIVVGLMSMAFMLFAGIRLG